MSVLFPYAYLAWDTGTRREGVRDEEAVVALLRRETFTWFVRCCDKIPFKNHLRHGPRVHLRDDPLLS